MVVVIGQSGFEEEKSEEGVTFEVGLESASPARF